MTVSTSGQELLHGDKIPDPLATRVYLISLSHSVGNVSLLAARISQASLDPGDAARLQAAAVDFSVAIQQDAQTTERDPLSENGVDFARDLDSRASVFLQQLSPGGRRQFLTFLQGKKERMRVNDPALAIAVNRHPHLVLASLSATPQTQNGMTPQYSTFYDESQISGSSANANRASYYGEVSVSGVTTCTVGQVCYEGYHRPSATLKIGNYGGTAYGASGYPANFIQAFQQVEVPMDSNAGYLAGTDEGTVFCSIIGRSIFDQFPLQDFRYFGFEFAFTLVQDDGQPPMGGKNCSHPSVPCQYYSVSYFCSAFSSPPDWQPRQVLSPTRNSYTLGGTACLRYPDTFGSPWFCLAKIAEIAGNPLGALAFTSLAIPYVGISYNCTNRDAGFAGYPPTGINPPWPF